MFKHTVEFIGDGIVAVTPLFNLGPSYMTPGFQARLGEYWNEGMKSELIEAALVAHISGMAWNRLDEHDQQANQQAAKTGTGMILSPVPFNPYDPGSEMFWIVTSFSEGSTMFLLPSEY